MKRKTLTIVSIISIIIISLILLGVTYGYFLTNITGNENAKSVEVVAGDSKLVFTDLSNSNTSEIIEPGYKNVKVFTVQNTGNVKATFSIYLVDVVNTFNRTQDLTYNIFKKSGTITDVTIATDLSETNGWSRVNTTENMTFPTAMSVIASNETITTPNDIYTYVLKVEYIDHPTENQNEDQGKTFAFKVNLRAQDSETNPYSEGTLAYHILDNGAQVLNAKTNQLEIDKTYVEKTEITKISDGNDMTDVGIFTAPDDYGTSYYYRGPVKNNYVNFAGFTWRIVRINGDGSIRLILDGTLDKICVEYNDDNTCKTYAGKKSTFINVSPSNNNAYIGYMYGLALTDTENIEQNRCLKLNGTNIEDLISTYSTKETCESNGGKWTTNSYEATHANLRNSNIKSVVENFYERYIENSTYNLHYEKYLADSLFCSDKTPSSNEELMVDKTNNSTLGFGTKTTVYGAAERLLYITSTSASPSLKCAEGENNDYSRYTSNLEMLTTLHNGININNDLKHPIQLLSADELVLAGSFKSTQNTQYYLYNELIDEPWWSGSPFASNDSTSIFSNYASTGPSINANGVHRDFGVRPVINLKGNLLVESGDGTEGEGAYTVKLPE